MGSKRKTQRSKKTLKTILVEYIAEPTNEFPARKKMAEILEYSHVQNLYNRFTTDELAALEAEGLEIRHQRSAARFGALADKLYDQAMAGDTKAASLWMDRVRGPVTQKAEIAGGATYIVEMPWGRPKSE